MVAVTITYRKPADAMKALEFASKTVGGFRVGPWNVNTERGRVHVQGNTLELSSDLFSQGSSLMGHFGFDADDENLNWK